ncbi:MAG: ABC transporter ATP-binding protein [Candidatus Zixiibacteriota bacterium]
MQISGISKSFGSIKAVNNCSLDINEGEFLVILGPSGCGKTTFLRIIAGLETSHSGEIWVSKSSWTSLSPQKRNVAMVFQSMALYPHRSVRGNIAYPLKLRKMKKQEIEYKVNWVCNLLKIKHLLNRKIRNLSGGESQRVALARALVREPSVFLLDEPLSNLDAQLRLRARAEIKKIQRELGITTLYVTHDQEEAIALADRIAVMNEGRIIQVGSSDSLMNKPEDIFVAKFLGKPPMNILSGSITGLSENNILVDLDSGSCVTSSNSIAFETIPVKSGIIKIGIRPDDIKLLSEICRNGEEKGWLLEGNIDLVERLERGFAIHFNCQDMTIIAFSWKYPDADQKLAWIPTSRCHFFNAESGSRVE